MGLVEPYKAILKRALSNLNGLDWDDPVPKVEQEFWRSQLKLWPALSCLRVARSTIPPDAVVPLRVRLIVTLMQAPHVQAHAFTYHASCLLVSGHHSY